MARFGVSRRLSEALGGSKIKAALGDESKAGAGAPEDEVTQKVEPLEFDAVQPVGRAGAVTPSKFSLKAIPPHGGGVPVAVAVAVAEAVAVAVAVPVAVGVGLGQPVPST